MVIERGAIFWADLGAPIGSRPAKRRPVLVVQSDAFTRTRLATVIVAAFTSNTELAIWPGNVFVPALSSGLPRDSVVNITAVAAIDREELDDPVGTLPFALMREVERGLRAILGL